MVNAERIWASSGLWRAFADSGTSLLVDPTCMPIKMLVIVQSKPSCFPISSHELFNILDDASEKNTWLCGTTKSMQIYVFDGEAGKIGLEPKKLVACISFVLEHKLNFDYYYGLLFKFDHYS
ncbi:hypothetical protein JHK87_043281 [Glycine soja]|nr:hypothetical protein JHK87_043281 [Glycine soja]